MITTVNSYLMAAVCSANEHTSSIVFDDSEIKTSISLFRRFNPVSVMIYCVSSGVLNSSFVVLANSVLV